MTGQFILKNNDKTILVNIIDDTIIIKNGLPTTRIPVNSIKYIHKFQHPSRISELKVLYVKKNGKPKIAKIKADSTTPEFSSLIDTIVMMNPEADTINKPEHEARSLFKISRINVSLAGLILGLAYMVLFIIFFPDIVHGLDKGFDSADLRQIAAGYTFRSYNVEISGIIRPDYAMVETTRGKGKLAVDYFYPVVSPEWEKHDLVYIILATGNIDSQEINELSDPDTPIRGVLRSVFWESLSHENLDYFKNNIRIDLAPNVKLVEYKADTGRDFSHASTVLTVSALIALSVLAAVFIIVKIQDRNRKLP